jgi:hypothetical protein
MNVFTRRRIAVIVSLLLLFPVARAQDTGAPARWSSQQAIEWAQRTPWLVGSNYTPAYAINQLEMWQPDTFDAQQIDRELQWAQDLGFTCMRVFLHHLLWEQDADGFQKRMDEFLSIAERHKIGVMFVLFDSCWDPNPKLGKQHEPRQGVHNSGWVQSPGAHDLLDPSRRALLEAYVKGVVGRFKDDPRVKVWDVWNEPDNTNDKSYGTANLKQEPADKKQRTLELLPRVFQWAREAKPMQPLTSGLWLGDRKADPSRLLPMEKAQLDGSDVISFHCYDNLDGMKQWVRNLRPLDRALICTEYMARPMGSRFDPILGYLKQEKIGAMNWGFVAGKTNTIYPWDSWQKHYDREPPVWFHDIFRGDGSPFDAKEVGYIRSVTGAAAVAPSSGTP